VLKQDMRLGQAYDHRYEAHVPEVQHNEPFSPS